MWHKATKNIELGSIKIKATGAEIKLSQQQQRADSERQPKGGERRGSQSKAGNIPFSKKNSRLMDGGHGGEDKSMKQYPMSSRATVTQTADFDKKLGKPFSFLSSVGGQDANT